MRSKPSRSGTVPSFILNFFSFLSTGVQGWEGSREEAPALS